MFTLLWAISTVIYTYYSTKDVDMSANPAMKYVQYFMPIMFLGFFNSYASGLTCYMFFSNLINILQIIFTKKFIFDDEKIRKELEVQN
ncbi:MAG: YidC/Oxa1 family membrane protein insertase [Saprospiraceae bacterium]|nr:YidC/Oxa1 family membrane protein insertase [Saprospiraceae bacterium]